jgi:hypothetical protein
MLTFKDLKFDPPDSLGYSRAFLDFPNGYGLSVVTGPYVYCGPGTFEVAIFYNDKICYDTPLTSDVLGYQTPEDIDEIIQKVEKFS